MAGRTVDLAFRADLSQLVSEMKTLPGMTEAQAKKMAGSLERQIKKAEKASVKASKASAAANRRATSAAKDTTSALKQTEEVGGEASSVMGGVASALDLVSPSAGAAARGIGDLSGGIEMVARAGPGLVFGLGAIGVAAAAIGVAFKIFSSELDEAEEKMKAAADRAVLMSQIFGTIKTDKARVDLQLLITDIEASADAREKAGEALDALNAKDRAAATFSKQKEKLLENVRTARERHTVALSQSAAVTERGNLLNANALEGIKAIAVELGAMPSDVSPGFVNAAEATEELNSATAGLSAARSLLGSVSKQQQQHEDKLLTLGKRKAALQKKNAKGSSKASKETLSALDKLIKKTDDFITPETDSKFYALTKHLEDLNQAAKEGGAAVADVLAPSIAAVKYEMAGIESMAELEAIDQLLEKVDKLAPGPVLDRMGKLAALFDDVGSAMEANEGQADELGAAYEQVGEAMRAEAVKTTEKIKEEGEARARAAHAEAKATTQLWIDSYGRIAQAATMVTGELLSRAQETAQEEIDIQANKVSTIEESLSDAQDHLTDLNERAKEDDVSRQQAATRARIGLIKSEMRAAKSAERKITEEQNKAVQKAFVLNQAAKISEVAMNTAAGITALLPVAGSVLNPAVIAGIATVAALGATQAGIIASQESPAAYHLGGIVGSRPDERQITARAGEGVLTRQGVQAIGGEAGLSAANRGQAGGPMVVQMVYRHKVLDEVLQGSLSRGGPITAAINSRSPRGRRNPYGRRAG